ncbi:hypothetical protein BKA80DRAFT_314144 [Phyllosticta citrichinensis]
MLWESASAAISDFKALCDDQGREAIKQYELSSAPVKALKDFVKDVEGVAVELHAWNKAAEEANYRDYAELERLDEAVKKLIKEGVYEYEPIEDSTDLIAEHNELTMELVRILASVPDNGTS